MKKITFSFIAVLFATATSFSRTATKNESEVDNLLFEEASAREVFPTVNFFVFPQICDLQMLSTSRVNFGPYEFVLSKDLNSMTDVELENLKTRALNKACSESGSDLLLEPFYTSTVYNYDTKMIYIKISGFPAKYINFRTLSQSDIEMLAKLYPNGIPANYKQEIVTTAKSGTK